MCNFYFVIMTRDLWRIVFFLKSEGKHIYPLWSKPLTETTLHNSLNITGLKGQMYQLYTGQMSEVIYYRSHFSLTFRQEVSQFDWVNISTDLQRKWCEHLGFKMSGMYSRPAMFIKCSFNQGNLLCELLKYFFLNFVL